jgi:hypothetical protein
LAYLTRKEYWVMDGLTHSAGIVRTFKCVRFTEKIIRGEDLKPPTLGPEPDAHRNTYLVL